MPNMANNKRKAEYSSVTNKRTKLTRDQATNVAKIARRVFMRGIETKENIGSWNQVTGVSSSSTVFQEITALGQGTAATGRIGDRIKSVGFKIKASVIAQAPITAFSQAGVRFIVVRGKEPLTAADLPAGTVATLNHDKYTVLCDKYYNMGTDYQQIHFSYDYRGVTNVGYDNTSATAIVHPIYMMILGYSATGAGASTGYLQTGSWQHYFKDA